MTRPRSIYFMFAGICGLALVLVFLCTQSVQNVDAQTQTQLVPLVTDQTPLGLSNSFGVPQTGVGDRN